MKTTTSSKGFTLIELLVVIAIIGLLAGLLFPAIGSALTTAKKQKASTVARSIESAIMLYSNDYSGRLPIPSSAYGVADSTTVNDDRSKNIMMVLMALNGGFPENANYGLNPTRKVYIDTERASDDGEFLDPWGNQYHIILDQNFDGKIQYLNASGESHRKKVVVVSAGPDGEFGGDTSADAQNKDNAANVQLEN